MVVHEAVGPEIGHAHAIITWTHLSHSDPSLAIWLMGQDNSPHSADSLCTPLVSLRV